MLIKLFSKLSVFLVLAFVVQACAANISEPVSSPPAQPTISPVFDGGRAYQDVATQLDFGPRTPDSPGHAQIVEWLQAELEAANWEVSVQQVPYNDYTIQNVVAKRGQGHPWVIFGAHYDTRIFADQDPDPEKHTQPVPGANDGASGVAVLLGLARAFPQDLPGEIWLVFFDAEDNGRIAEWDWILGSRAFVDELEGQPDAVVIPDMIGDADLNIYWEQNSDPGLTREIWGVAENLGYADHFIASAKYRMLDDHTPFLQAGIPAVDLIDFDYPYWHTVDDTLDKVSAQSLQMVGDVLLQWTLTKLSSKTVP
jgi:glutaminyl-peptide cyclotransferase